MTPDIELTFLGTGTSAGVPMIACDCAVCTSANPLNHRTRPSVFVRYAGPRGSTTTVLIDTSPELRLQALATGLKKIDAVVYTHAHADHIMGLDDLRRFNAVQGGALDLWADAGTYATLSTCFAYAFKEPEPELKMFRPHLEHRVIHGPFVIGGVTWTPIPLIHGKMHVLGFRIGNLAYCTDVSEIPESSYAPLEGLDILVLDALQWKKHATHLTLEEALAAAARLRPKRTYFTHIAHGIEHEEVSRLLPRGVALAYDGLVISTKDAAPAAAHG
jgi:phosphoribosyl 1,2-cyclic phosphate phosphodiesterase